MALEGYFNSNIKKIIAFKNPIIEVEKVKNQEIVHRKISRFQKRRNQ
jgi:hypothetical protein